MLVLFIKKKKKRKEKKKKIISAGARYTKSIASLELRHKEHNNDPYSEESGDDIEVNGRARALS